MSIEPGCLVIYIGRQEPESWGKSYIVEEIINKEFSQCKNCGDNSIAAVLDDGIPTCLCAIKRIDDYEPEQIKTEEMTV